MHDFGINTDLINEIKTDNNNNNDKIIKKELINFVKNNFLNMEYPICEATFSLKKQIVNIKTRVVNKRKDNIKNTIPEIKTGDKLKLVKNKELLINNKFNKYLGEINKEITNILIPYLEFNKIKLNSIIVINNSANFFAVNI